MPSAVSLRIETLCSQRGPLGVTALRQLDEELYREVLREFGSWRQALRACGICRRRRRRHKLRFQEIAGLSGLYLMTLQRV